MKHIRLITPPLHITIPHRITIQPILHPRTIHPSNISIHNLPIIKSGASIHAGNQTGAIKSHEIPAVEARVAKNVELGVGADFTIAADFFFVNVDCVRGWDGWAVESWLLEAFDHGDL